MDFRPAQPQDWGFLCSSFLSSFRAASTHAEGLTGKQAVSLLTNLVANGWECMVAEMEGVIAGWIVYDKNQRLGWVYVRQMFRGSGLALLLLQKAGIDPRLPIVSPFVPNRLRDKCPLKLTIHQRPFLTVPNADALH
jgi:hypothetical protein